MLVKDRVPLVCHSVLITTNCPNEQLEATEEYWMSGSHFNANQSKIQCCKIRRKCRNVSEIIREPKGVCLEDCDQEKKRLVGDCSSWRRAK